MVGNRRRPGTRLVFLAARAAASIWLMATPFVGASAQTCVDEALTETGKVPLPDLGVGSYQGFMGGLYPDGSPIRPPEHLASGMEIAADQVEPLGRDGKPDPAGGVIVMISVGISNSNMMFAGSGGADNLPVAFMTRANADPARNPQLVIVNGAQGGEALEDWVDPQAAAWTNLEQYLAKAGVTPAQVQVAWVHLTSRGGDGPFPTGAEVRQGEFEQVARDLKLHFPNVKLAYYSTRTFSVAPIPKSAEPQTYEDGFAVQWMIGRQIRGDADLNFDPGRGEAVVPWLSWGPYLWTDGLNPRSDGLVWRFEDQGCGVHPHTSGVAKNAAQLYAFFKTDPTTTPWYLRSSLTGQPPQQVEVTADPAVGPAPLTVQFHASAIDPDGQVTEIVWTFGDGTFSYNPQADPADPLRIQDNPNPKKVFNTPGDYAAYVTITDNAGNAVTRTVQVTVGGVSPYAGTDQGTGQGTGGREAPPPSQGTTGESAVVLAAAGVSIAEVQLTWTGAALDRRGYKLERSLDGETGWSEIARLGLDVTSYTDMELTPATQYFYRLRLSSQGDGTFSNTVSVTTAEAQLSRNAGTPAAQEGSPGNSGAPDEAPPPAGPGFNLSTASLLAIAFSSGIIVALVAVWYARRGRGR